jgi:uncharacterized protein YcgL (UPF0745 family)
MKRSQAPVESVQTEVFGQPILVLIFPLRRLSATARLDVADTYSVEALDICDMFFDAQLELIRKCTLR